MQCLLPGCQQCPVAVAGLGPEAKHVQGTGCPWVVQKTLLAAMTRTAGKTVTANQQLACLVAQTMGQSEVVAVGAQQVAGGLQDLIDRQ